MLTPVNRSGMERTYVQLISQSKINRSRAQDTRRLRKIGYVTAGLAVLYAIPHIWWGLGSDWLAPGDMSSDSGLGSSSLLRFIAFYGMGALAILSAVMTFDMMRPSRRWFPTWFLALHGWAIGVLLVIRGGIGLTESTLILAGARDCPFVGCQGEPPGRSQVGMTGFFWEPLFVVWGVALLLTTWLWTRTRRA